MDAFTNVIIGAKFGANELGDVSALLDGTNVLSSVRFCRLSEFDWDDDGLANGIDPEPYANNGDCHGQGDGWVAACYTNAAEIAAAGGWTNWVAAIVANDDDNWWYSFTVTAGEFDTVANTMDFGDYSCLEVGFGGGRLHDALAVKGAATIDATGTVLRLVNEAQEGGKVRGGAYTVLSSAGGLTGTFDSVECVGFRHVPEVMYTGTDVVVNIPESGLVILIK